MKQFAPLFWYVTGGGIIASGIYLFYIGKTRHSWVGRNDYIRNDYNVYW